MSFDTKTNTINVQNLSELTADSGAFFLKVVKDVALTPGASKEVIDDWKTIEAWLGCLGRDLCDADYKKFGTVSSP